jgi:heme-degrading monooxygenase HmoA
MADAPSVAVDQPQRTLHVFASREDGAVVMDLWENEDDFRRMMDDLEFRRNVEAADWPSEPKVEIYEVRATMQ